MLGRSSVEERMRRALDLSNSQESQVVLVASDQALTRFANNHIHQNVYESNSVVTFTAVDGQKVGTAATNDLSDEGLAKAAKRAARHAESATPDSHFPGLAGPAAFQPVQAFNQQTAECDPKTRAEAVGHICQEAKEQGLTAYGAFSTAAHEIAVANSRGQFAYHAGTRANIQATIAGANGSSVSENSSWRIEDLDARSVAKAAIERARQAQDPQPIEPGSYTVILGPYAVMDILDNLNWTGVSAKNVQEGSSWMVGRLGKQAMSPMVSIWDDGLEPHSVPLPFDFEGTPRQRVSIVENGIVKGPVHDRRTASIDNTVSTGHSSPPYMLWFSGPIALHLNMATGDSSLEEMISSTERGLFVNRFWYTRTVHPRDCVITGMTRDGLWLIEKGKLSYPVKDMRFTQSYVEALANVVAVGSQQKLRITEMGSSVCVPAVKISAFKFTGITA